MEVGVREAAKAGTAMESEKDKAAGELKEVCSPHVSPCGALRHASERESNKLKTF
jgi:hypothetical protein